MSAVCPNGHDTVSTDYCDVCGSPVAAGASSEAPVPAAPAAAPSGNSLDLPPVGGESGPKDCPNCGTPNASSSLFCEACGYDFTTGALPAAAPASLEGVSAAGLESPAPPVGEPAGAGLAPESEQPPAFAPDVAAAETESEAEGTPDGSGELAGLNAAEELDADGLSVSAEGEPGDGEPGPGEPGDGGIPAPDAPESPEAPDGSDAPEGAGAFEGAGASEGAGAPSEPALVSGEAEAGAGEQPPVLGGVDPNVPPRIPFQWVAEVWIDPDWYADQQAEEPLPSAGLPVVVPLRIASALIGRASASRNIVPDIDCSADPGVSRRHAQLTTDGSRWFVEDLQSSNGTFVGPASGPLPDDPIAVGPKTEVGDNRIYVGAWTRIVVRRATDEEIAIG